MEIHRDNIAAMYAPFSEYVSNVAKLMVWHIWDLTKRSGTTVGEQMENVAWLSRLATLDRRVLTDAASLPEWQKTRDQLINLISKCESKDQTYLMEQQCLNLLLPWFQPKFRDNYIFPEQPFHHLWYTMHEENSLVAVHFINADMPESPFLDIEKFGGYLLRVIENACQKYPTVQEVECGTWMNNVPRFLKYWPETYHNNRQDWEDTGGFGPGWWGQYMTAAGRFNEKAAEILRRTCKHRNPLSIGRCPVKDAITHLRDYLK
jgi:hypothetical protein